MIQKFVCLPLFFALSLPAFADDCPTAQTAKLGFLLERPGAQAEIRFTSDHFVHAVNTFAGGKRQDALYYRGLFLVSRFDDTARTINVPLSDLRSIFPLDLTTRRALTYAPADPTKAGALVSIEMTVTGQERLQLGPCTYNVLVIRNRFLNAEGRVLSEHTDLYSQDLSFILAKRYDERGGVQTTVKYQSIKPLNRS
ncbi:hypothetical protein [Microvirga terricola]|uniref:Lipid/polyisoprenoid-binding YceI-like domain-containing protein n=1 Tax=Microvirga terricola TaxID=2719797 RepID=A0ABX0VDW1_9HYPH|nr:hypothetical protein [Microvirga terricola]NIX78017.1 hypothetical protein [Microvirga terricola]